MGLHRLPPPADHAADHHFRPALSFHHPDPAPAPMTAAAEAARKALHLECRRYGSAYFERFGVWPAGWCTC